MTLNMRKLRRELCVDRKPDVQCCQWLVWWHDPEISKWKKVRDEAILMLLKEKK